MRIAGAALVLLAFGCEDPPRVPEHHVVVTTDCTGPLKVSRYRFPATTFDTNCSGDLSGWCGTQSAKGVHVSGDLEVYRFVLTGTEEFGPSRYELELVPEGHSAAEYSIFNPNNRLIWCGWYVNDRLEPKEGARTACYHTRKTCFAEITVER